MKNKRIKQERLREFPFTLAGAYYHHVYVNESEDGRAIVFSGNDWPRTPTVDCVVFKDLSDLTILRLQLTLSYGTVLKKVVYKTWLVRLISITPKLTLQEFAQSILADEEWVRDILDIKEEFKHLCIANAYSISRLKEPARLLKAAVEMPPEEFVPLSAAQNYQERRNK